MPATSITIDLEQFTTFGDLLKFLRRRSGLTQRDLSIAVGYSVPQISRLEQNQRLPDLAMVNARFVEALDLGGQPAVAARLLSLAQAMRRDDAPAPGLPPYKGLLFFDEADADQFFGREALTETLLARLANPASQNLRFLAVVGASGSGKSSLVRAGLVPALRWRPESSGWPVAVLTPAAHPLDVLAAALVSDGKPSPEAGRLAEAMAGDQRGLTLHLNQMPSRGAAAPGSQGYAARPSVGARTPQQLLLVVDQFEELFTLCRSEPEQAAFVDNLLAAAGEAGGAAIVVIALRADFYSRCARFAGLREALAHHQEYIGPMTAAELRRAIEEPARRGHWDLEPGLVDLLLNDLGAGGSHPPEPGALPLLSHTLLETWQRRRGQTLTLSGYAASGGVKGAIAETAEAVFHDQFDPAQRSIARRIFLRLTELGEEGVTADTRRRASFAELMPDQGNAEAVREVLQALADARLITTEQETAEVAHEALIREWPTLRGWLEEDREGLRLHRHLTEAAQEWEKLGREPGGLYRGARLAQAQEWAAAAENASALNALERAFLAAASASAEREEQERESARQRELEAALQLAASAQKLGETEKQRADEQTRSAHLLRRRAQYLLGAFVLAIVLAGAALYFGNRAQQIAGAAQEASRLATARELAADAVNNLDVDPERSVLLALKAVSFADLPETEGALHQSVATTRLQMTLTGHQGVVWSVAYSPDGQRLATTSQDKTAKIWEISTGKLLLTLSGHNDAVNGIAFSPDGTRIATTSDDGTAMLWDAATGQALHTFTGHQGPVLRVAFSPNGTQLATTGSDGTAQLFETKSHKPILTVHSNGQSLWDVAFSPDGTRFATAETYGPVTVWDATTGQAVRSFPVAGYNQVVAFSPDGTRLAASDDQHIMVWDAASGALDLQLTSHNYFAKALAFSPDGTRLAVVGDETKATVWDTATGQQLFTLAGHTAQLNGLAFSPDGRHIATSGWDMTAKVWDATPTHEALTISAPSVRGTGFVL